MYVTANSCVLSQLGESNKRGLVPTDFITEVYGPSAADPNVCESNRARAAGKCVCTMMAAIALCRDTSGSHHQTAVYQPL